MAFLQKKKKKVFDIWPVSNFHGLSSSMDFITLAYTTRLPSVPSSQQLKWLSLLDPLNCVPQDSSEREGLTEIITHFVYTISQL